MSKAVQILVDGVTPTYTTGVPRIDILQFQDLAAWAAGGVTFMTRADQCAVPGPTGYKAQWANQMPGGSALVARLVDTATGTLTVQAKDAAYLGGQKTVLASDNTDVKMALSSNPLTATGAFSIYVALNAIDNTFTIFGNTNVGKLTGNLVNNEIRFALNNSTAALTKDIGVTAYNRDILIGFFRTADGHLKIRHKLRGSAWVETVSGSAFPAVSIDNVLSFGAYNTANAGYSPNGRWGLMMVAPAVDLTDVAHDDVQASIEDYLVNYYGMG